MPFGFFTLDTPINEPTLEYRPGSPERIAVLEAYRKMYNDHVKVPLYLGNEEIYTQNTKDICPPHDHQHVVGTYSLAEEKHEALARGGCVRRG